MFAFAGCVLRGRSFPDSYMSADNLKAMSAYLLGANGKSAKIAAAFVAYWAWNRRRAMSVDLVSIRGKAHVTQTSSEDRC
jgi:hypothetical protein